MSGALSLVQGKSIGFSYQNNGGNQNLTGSPDYGARIKIIGDPGNGCSSNQYAQFNVAAFAGPTYNSNGMESGRNYMRSCWTSIWDLSLARNIRLGGKRSVQFRAEAYNAFNQFFVTGRSTTVQYTNPVDQVVVNNQYQLGRHPEPEPAEAVIRRLRRGQRLECRKDRPAVYSLLVLTS